MSTPNDDSQKKGFTCDRIETASNVDEMPGNNLIEAERQLSVFANAKKHWRVLLIGKFHSMQFICVMLISVQPVSVSQQPRFTAST